MAKVKLGDRPKTFKRTVKFPMLDGSEGQIEMIYTYRTRTEYGKMIDEIIKASSDAVPATGDAFSMASAMAANSQSAADHIMLAAEGWNLEDQEFSLEKILQLADEIPAAAAAIIEGYRVGCTEGRLGN